MKKRVFSAVLAVALVAALSLTLAACGAKSGVKKTVAAFQKACNDLNVEAALETVDPAVAGVLKLGTGLLGTLTGKTDEELFSMLSSALGAHSDALGIASFKTLKIKVKDVAVTDKDALARAQLTFEDLEGGEKSVDAELSLKQDDGKTWYISGVRF